MPTNKLTVAPTEADLEARIHNAIELAFPWLDRRSIRHQTTFSLTFGRKKIEIAGKQASRAEARADILLYEGDRPIAVLELKRPGIPLTDNDNAQGLSYARLLNPSPPLVIVTNGAELQIIETHSGHSWQPKARTEQAFYALMTSATRAATADIKRAVDTLMGTNSSVWRSAIRQTTSEILAELSASEENPSRTFARGFLFPRKATASVLTHVLNNERLILLEGPPLAGKSSVLREIVLRTNSQPALASLYIESGSGCDILQSLSDTLSRSLEWPVTRDEARVWLKLISQDADNKLLLLVDGFSAGDDDGRREIEDLSSLTDGQGLSIIVAVDDVPADSLTTAPNRRGLSVIGRRTKRVKLEALDDQEFQRAQQILMKQRFSFQPGANFSPEFRQPWVLRSICTPLLTEVAVAPPDRSLALPPLLSLDLIRHARDRFDDHELRRLFNAIASAVVTDAKDHDRDDLLISESVEVNVVRRETLRQYVNADELKGLVDHGFAKPAMHGSGPAVLYIRLPELLASELAKILSRELDSQVRQDSSYAARNIAAAASCLPFGDIIAAQAVLDTIKRLGPLASEFVTSLLETRPEIEQIAPGTRFATYFPGAGAIEVLVQKDGRASIEIDGERHEIDIGENGPLEAYPNSFQWLILSHLAASPLTIETPDGSIRIDPKILQRVGAANIVLRRPSGDDQMRLIPTVDLPGYGQIVHFKAGIVEPITFSIFQYLAREWQNANVWIDTAFNTNSLSLLSRIHIALLRLSASAHDGQANWARTILDTRVLPAFSSLLGKYIVQKE